VSKEKPGSGSTRLLARERERRFAVERSNRMLGDERK